MDRLLVAGVASAAIGALAGCSSADWTAVEAARMREQISELQKRADAQEARPAPATGEPGAPAADVAALRAGFEALRKEVEALKSPPGRVSLDSGDVASLRKEVEALREGIAKTGGADDGTLRTRIAEIVKEQQEENLKRLREQQAEALRRFQASRRGVQGIVPGPLTAEARAAAGLPEGARGVAVQEVIPGSAAAKAGLQPGDIVVGLDGAEIPEGHHLRELVAKKRPGDRVSLEFVRKGAPRATVDLTVEAGASGTAGGVWQGTPRGGPQTIPNQYPGPPIAP